MRRNGREITPPKQRSGTTTRRATRSKPGPDPNRIKAQNAFLRRFLREKQAAWDAMAPAQRRAARAEWRRFVKSINEGRYRKVIIE